MNSPPQDPNNLPAMVTMPVARWNQVLEVLGGQPWREINTLIVDIHRQVQDAMRAQIPQQQMAKAPDNV